MRTFLGGLIKQPRKSTISMAVWTKRPRKWEFFLAFWWNSQGKAQFPWRFDEKAKEMRTFLGVICKPPRQLQIFLAAYKIRHEIIFSWLLTSTAKVTLYSLAVQSWPPRKSLAAKVIRFWCSEFWLSENEGCNSVICVYTFFNSWWICELPDPKNENFSSEDQWTYMQKQSLA